MIWSTDTPPLKALRGREGPNVMRFNLDQVQGLLVCLFTTKLNALFQPRRESSRSEVCFFLKEMKRRDRDPLRSLVRSK